MPFEYQFKIIDWVDRSRTRLMLSIVLLAIGGVFASRAMVEQQGIISAPVTNVAFQPSSIGRSDTHSFRPIQDIKLGQRVVGQNPIRSQAETIKPNPDEWRHLSLTMVKPSGRRIWIELLRPTEWLRLVNARVGYSMQLSLDELGIAGPAEVKSIDRCVIIEDGDSPIVTGTFRHEIDASLDVLQLKFQCNDEVTLVTTNHLFWSIDRGEFVPASRLKIGDRVSTLAGETLVESVSVVDYCGFVYNIETTEHVYRVGTAGTLVHNACGDIALGLAQAPTHSAKGLLARFAKKVGGSTWYNWHADGLIANNSWRYFGDVFHEAARNAKTIHFNLDGINSLSDAYRAGGVSNAFSVNVTNAEFRALLDNKSFLNKTVFYDPGGVIVPTSEVLKRAGL